MCDVCGRQRGRRPERDRQTEGEDLGEERKSRMERQREEGERGRQPDTERGRERDRKERVGRDKV